MSSQESRRKTNNEHPDRTPYSGTIKPKVATLMNQCCSMKREYRIVHPDEIVCEKSEQNLMTIVVSKDGDYIQHFWGDKKG
jgi:hypothetical protein